MLGFLKYTTRSPDREIDIKLGSNVRDLLKIISPELKNKMTPLISETGQPTRALLILINGTEIGALDGSETVLNEQDEIVLLPAIHGG